TYDECSAVGQGRGVVVLWAGMASVEGSEELVRRSLDRFGGIEYLLLDVPEHSGRFGAAYLGSNDAAIALEFLDRPSEDVAAMFESRWAEVIAPTTSSADLAGWFGIAPPTNTPEHGVSAPLCS
ncbi:MAG: hypothetical protein Q8Q52_01545, partial [Acidimicrobiia bacterium]|nr:hypothetical protein [Acidimicrobiia bacterium]